MIRSRRGRSPDDPFQSLGDNQTTFRTAYRRQIPHDKKRACRRKPVLVLFEIIYS